MPILTIKKTEIFGTDEWKKKMSSNGDILKNNDIRKILLVHGTFTGDDALGLFNLFEPFNKKISDFLRKNGKGLVNKLTKDVGNYTPEYANILGTYSNMNCGLFVSIDTAKSSISLMVCRHCSCSPNSSCK